MSIVLPVVALAFVAYCIWLAVRMINRRELWAKRTLAAAIGLPLLYFLSFGPVCWLNERSGTPILKGYGSSGTADDYIFIAYRPLFEIAAPYPRSIWSDFTYWYAEVGTRNADLAIWLTADKGPPEVAGFGWQRPDDDYGR